jgi:DNA-binding transcriptional regulator YiaG
MASMKLLKRDVLGRVRTPRAKREEILDEFEGSGVSGAEFAELVGIKYPTLASWIQRRRRERGTYGRKAPVKPAQKVRFLEAVVAKADPSSTALEVEVPGGARLRITEAGQVPLAVQLIRSLASC